MVIELEVEGPGLAFYMHVERTPGQILAGLTAIRDAMDDGIDQLGLRVDCRVDDKHIPDTLPCAVASAAIELVRAEVSPEENLESLLSAIAAICMKAPSSMGGGDV